MSENDQLEQEAASGDAQRACMGWGASRVGGTGLKFVCDPVDVGSQGNHVGVAAGRSGPCRN